MRKSMVAAFAFLSILWFARCYTGGGGAVAAAANPCSNNGHGSADPNAPIVCIDRNALDQPGYQPDPNPVPANHSATMHFWFNDGGGEMDVQFTYDTPVHNLTCNGPHCTVTIDPNVPPHANLHRKYTIIDRSPGGKHLDPEVIIEP